MDSVGTFEAKTKLTELLDRVARGEEILITRHGTPVAKLVPYSARSLDEVSRAVAELEAFRESAVLNPPGKERLTIRGLINEGRRW